MKSSRRIVIAGVCIAAILSVVAYSVKFREPSKSPYFYVTILKALYGTIDSGLYRFSISDFSEAGTGSFDDAFIRDHKFIDFGLGNDFVPRKICSYENAKLVAWGRNGIDSVASAKIFQINNAGEKKLLMDSSDARFRDCGTGKIHGKTIFATITHGQGYLYLRVMETGEEHIYHVPYTGIQGKRATLLHFLQFADLDGDGDDEIYYSSTTPYFWGGSAETYEEGTVYRATFPKTFEDIQLEDVGLERPAFVRRLGKFIGVAGIPSIVTLYEGMLWANGQSLVPIRIVRHSYKDGKIEKRVALTLDGHKECKGINSSRVMDRPTFQIGCDNGILYFIGEKPNSEDFEIVKKYDLSGGLSEEYLKKRSSLRSQDLTSIHTIVGVNVDSDVTDELFIGINNVGLALLDPDTGKIGKIPYRFSHDRVYERDEWFVVEDISPTLGEGFLSEKEFFNFR